MQLMKTITFKGEIELNGKRLPINARLNQGCYEEILKQLHGQITAMQSYHSKVLVFMTLFRVHDFSETNHLFSCFMRKLKKRLMRQYRFTRIGHLWVREHGISEGQHYHLALFLDGNLVQYPKKIFELCVDIWEGWGQPRPAFTGRKSYYMLRRNDEPAFQVAFYHLSYFAKTRTKDNRPPSTNDYSASRIKPK